MWGCKKSEDDLSRGGCGQYRNFINVPLFAVPKQTSMILYKDLTRLFTHSSKCVDHNGDFYLGLSSIELSSHATLLTKLGYKRFLLARTDAEVVCGVLAFQKEVCD